MSRVIFSALAIAGFLPLSEARLPTSQIAGRVLMADDFERDLSQWEIVGEKALSIGPSGDPRHGSVLMLTPNGDVAALARGSGAWGAVRVEGEMLFPTAVDNYLGFLYNFTRTGRRLDFGLIYVKGNESYLQLNPHRDFNVSRLMYPEFHVPLVGRSAVVTGQWQRFAFEVAGAAAHVYVGDLSTPQLTFAELELDRGEVGLQPRSVGGPVWVDNVRIRSIPSLSYTGPAIPSLEYAPASVITEWQVAGPFDRTDDGIARAPGSAAWRPFGADARGAVVSGRVVDYHGPRTVAYFRTTVRMAADEQAELQISTADDLAVWVNGLFASFVSRQDAAWFDFADNKAHAGRRVPLSLRSGPNDIVVRVRGGTYASGGFYARLK